MNGKKKILSKKRQRCWLSLLLAWSFCLGTITVPAYAGESAKKKLENYSSHVRTVIPIGHTVGIKLFSDGLMVVNLSESMDGEGKLSPARACGIQTGDLLIELNNEDLKSTEQLQAALQENKEQPVSLTIKRGAKTLSFKTTPQSDANGVYRLGAWVRDSMAGIGTVTYYDPANDTFGALGHGITDVDTAQLMPIASGSVIPSVVADVKKGKGGTPGELRGDFKTNVELGTLDCNSSNGVFGKLTDSSIVTGQPMEIARKNEIKRGKATILSNVNGDEVKEYSVKITKILKNGDSGRDMMLSITDNELLSQTGGIVQGMSGSPIIQNGKLIGAVTHVFVNDPTKGYGIFIENMLDAAG